MNKNYVIYVNNVAVKVSYEIYKAYWKSVERERYLDRLAKKHEVHLDHVFDEYESNTIEYKLIEDKNPTRNEALKLEMIDSLLQSLKRIPAEDQHLIQALYFEELTQTEYAHKIGTSQQVISYRHLGILEKLKKIIQRV